MQYRIICTNQEPVGVTHDHAHIVAVGTGTSSTHYDRKWSLAEVLQAMDRGDTFYTRGEQSGRIASVERYRCSRCMTTSIRSSPDAVRDNNLDNLNRCA